MTVDVLDGISLADATTLVPYWQTAPVVLKRAVSASELTPDPDTVRAILTETDLPARLITGAEGGTFTVERGPFAQFDPPKGPWTVLIQALEHLFPEYDQLRQALNWLPSWRFEDCMLSWANVGGSVGRHFDHFDVFLVQLSGRREWSIGPRADAETPLEPDQPLALVTSGPPDLTVTVEPGDVIYIPPHVIHHGVSLDPDCMTLSIGFRAPDVGQVLESLIEQLGDEVPWHRYQDGTLTPRRGTAEITEADLDRVRALLIDYASDSERLARAFGMRVTEPYLEPSDETEGRSMTDPVDWSEADTWVLDPGCRMAYFEKNLYINGEWIGDQAPDALFGLADQRTIDRTVLSALDRNWQQRLHALVIAGQLAPSEDDR